MPPPIHLALVFHNHQPVGQFDYVNEHAAHVAYLPLVELLERFPAVHVGIHFSGHLLAWFRANHPSALDRLRMLVGRGQVELLTGGYYEPILVAIPDEDKIGQIGKLTETIKTTFNVTPQGAWLAERVWEPHLPRVLAEAGVGYVILDDQQFEAAGLDRKTDLFGYYMTEEQGRVVAVLPSLGILQEALPWGPIEDMLAYLKAEQEKPLTSGQPKLALCAQDGEKFGAWPGSYELCWGEGKYMERLFAALEKQTSWLRLVTPGAFMKRYLPEGRAYLPASSQAEVEAWSLPADAAIRYQRARRNVQQGGGGSYFVRGGIWRGFLMKYEEANHLQKRMGAVSAKVHGMRRGRKREEALELLWEAQAGDSYWHGIFGGIYLFKLRAAVYAALLEAEALADGDYQEFSLIAVDFDADGRQEVILTADPLSAIWAAGTGGALVELDYKPAQLNLLNVLTRRKEAYHTELVNAARAGNVVTPDSPIYTEVENIAPPYVRAEEPGLEGRLVYDWHRRASYLDHFLREDTTLREFYQARYAEQGDFVNLPYRIEIKSQPRSGRVSLTRDGHVWLGSKHQPITISKIFGYEQGADSYTVTYMLSHPSAAPVNARFGVELVLGFDGGDDFDYCGLYLNESHVRRALNTTSEQGQILRYTAENRLRGVSVETELGEPATLWWFPLETVSISESGYERSYQGTVFLNLWNITIPPERPWTVTIRQHIFRYAPDSQLPVPRTNNGYTNGPGNGR